MLGVFLITEIIMLSLGAFAVLFHGGGPDGFAVGETLNPIGAFTPAAASPEPAQALGLFFAFWSWVGFESTAMYGEESRDPKRIIPRATMLSVARHRVLLRVRLVDGGRGHRPAAVRSSSRRMPTTAGDIFFGPVREYYGEWAVTMFNILLVHRVLRVRHGLPQLRVALPVRAWPRGPLEAVAEDPRRHASKHGSPHIASFVQTGITLVIILAFLAAGMDPYVHLYTLLAILGTMAILIVQSLCAFAVIAYFHFHKNHPSSAHWFKTFLAPLLGGIGMLYVVYLLWEHKETAAGAASGTLLFKLTPWIVVGLFVFGAALALYFKFRDPSATN